MVNTMPIIWIKIIFSPKTNNPITKAIKIDTPAVTGVKRATSPPDENIKSVAISNAINDATARIINKRAGQCMAVWRRAGENKKIINPAHPSNMYISEIANNGWKEDETNFINTRAAPNDPAARSVSIKILFILYSQLLYAKNIHNRFQVSRFPRTPKSSAGISIHLFLFTPFNRAR